MTENIGKEMNFFEKIFNLILRALAWFFKPMSRTLTLALAGFVVFMISIMTMIPLRMAKAPIPNYNIFFAPIMAFIFLALFYRACVEEKEGRGITYGYLAALFAWPFLGEVASMPVDKGLITQLSNVNIKLIGGWIYVVVGWLMLTIMWKTKILKNSVAAFFLTFLGIWSFELYMDNYSSMVPVETMPVIANYVAIVFGILSIVVLVISWRSKSVTVKSLMGAVLYLTLSCLIMGSGQWKTPSKFYIKYEARAIEREIEELKKEYDHIINLKKYMIEKGLYKEETAVEKNEK